MQYADEKLRPLNIEFSPHVSEKLEEIAKRKGLTRKEAIEQLVKEDIEIMEKGEERLLEIFKASGTPITREDYEEQKKRKKERARGRASPSGRLSMWQHNLTKTVACVCVRTNLKK